MDNLIYGDVLADDTADDNQINEHIILHTPQHQQIQHLQIGTDGLDTPEVHGHHQFQTPQHLHISQDTLHTPEVQHLNTPEVQHLHTPQVQHLHTPQVQDLHTPQVQHLQIGEESLVTSRSLVLGQENALVTSESMVMSSGSLVLGQNALGTSESLVIGQENGLVTSESLVLGQESALHTIDTVKLEGIGTTQGDTLTVDGQQYITLHLADQNADVLEALRAQGLQHVHIEHTQPSNHAIQHIMYENVADIKPDDNASARHEEMYDTQPTEQTKHDDPPVYEEEPRVQHVQHTYDRIKLPQDGVNSNILTPPNNDDIQQQQNNHQEEAPTEEDLKFEEELKKLEAPPPQFVMGPPSESEEEDEINTSVLLRGVIEVADKGGDSGEREDDEIKDPTYEFNDLLVKGDVQSEEDEDAFSDEGIVQDEIIINTNNKKEVIVKRKHTLINTSQSKRLKTKMHSEDPELLREMHDKYNKLCIFCHKSHEHGCLLWDPMEKYQDLDQVGPPYTYGMPDQFLMGLSRIYEGTYSLFARDDIPAFTQFGPLKGRIVEESEFRKISLLEIDIENFWPIEASENDELMIENWLDTSDVEISNWLKFLLPESSEVNAPHYNVQRITKNGEIFFVTTEHILSGEELFMRAMEPPYRVYHNLAEVNRTTFACGLFHNIKDTGSQTILFDNMIYYVRHHVFVHSIHPGVFGAAYIYNCAICGEDQYTKGARVKHMTDNHQDEENIKAILKRDRRCYYCKKSFSTQAMLGHHIKYNHPRDEEVALGYECPVCKAKVKTKPTLKKHMQDTHLPINVTCEICGKVLKNRGTLKVHVMKIHQRRGLKQCRICDKTFSDIYQLRVHSLTHTKLRPFECQVDDCEQACTTKQCLQKHYRLKHGFNDTNMPEVVRTIELKDLPMFM